MTVDNAPLLDELNTVEENCVYTALALFPIGNERALSSAWRRTGYRKSPDGVLQTG